MVIFVRKTVARFYQDSEKIQICNSNKIAECLKTKKKLENHLKRSFLIFIST